MLSENDSYVLSKFRDQNFDSRTDMLEKKILTCYDSNSGGYNGELIYDLSSLGVASDWIDYSSAFITVPYVVSIKSITNTEASPAIIDLTNSIDQFGVQIKDGFHHLIDSMSVEVNGRTVQSIQNFSNMFYHMKYIMSASAEDILKNSATTGVFGESLSNLNYQAAADNLGVGYNIYTGTNVAGSAASRSARAHSQMNVDPTATGLPWINSSEIINNSAQSYYYKAGATTATVFTWVFYYRIQLKHISSFFENLPLTKATDIKLIIKYNSFSANVGVTASDGNFSINSYTQLSGHSCPVLIVPVLAAPATNAIFTITGNVLSTGLGETTPPAMRQTRLYVPSYKIRPEVASAMLTSFPQTKNQYLDIYSYSIPSVTAGGNIVWNITNGVTDPIFVMVIPFQKNTALTALIKGSQYQSVFDTAPGTTSGVYLKEFNVQVAGRNTFQLNENYAFDQFINEFSKLFALNGNNTLGITSGIINQVAWNKGYRCYVADVSRREPSEDNVSKAITITAQNAANVDIELICFVAYKKQIMMNTATGIMVE